MKSGSLSLLEPSGAVQACNGIALYREMRNDIGRGRLKYSESICLSDTFFNINTTRAVVGWNLGLHRNRLVINDGSHSEN